MVNKYLNLQGLSTFLNQLKNVFASKEEYDELASQVDVLYNQYDLDGGNSQTPDNTYENDHDGGGA